MSETNHIKTPKQDSFRGTGANKLGWGESGKMNSTLKRLSATFENEKQRSVKSNKETVICPKCKAKLKTNNPGRIPKHYPRNFSWYTSPPKNEICKGSWSEQPTDNFILSEKDSFSCYSGTFNVGDKVAIDFTRTTFRQHNPTMTEVFETEVLKVEIKRYLKMDGQEDGRQGEMVYFKDVPNPIPAHGLYNFIIKL